MKKGPNLTAEKGAETRAQRKSQQKIRFNLSPSDLACFKRNDVAPKSKCKATEVPRQSREKVESGKVQKALGKKEEKVLTGRNSFDEKVVFMEYDNIEVYIDHSRSKQSREPRSKESSKKSQPQPKSEGSQDLDEEIVSSCVRVITEETDYTLRTPPNLTPRSSYYHPELYMAMGSVERAYTPRDKRSATIEESRNNFVIDFEGIEEDGRTTVMVKNIPNKYSQETLLQEFSVHFENRFDFFYLPIDKDNDCNVGYAFVNFTGAESLRQFYLEFHGKRWARYKSPKICHISYARYQGTLELANHFRHSKILQHKDRKLKPLIGMQEANRIRDIEEMVRLQRERD